MDDKTPEKLPFIPVGEQAPAPGIEPKQQDTSNNMLSTVTDGYKTKGQGSQIHLSSKQNLVLFSLTIATVLIVMAIGYFLFKDILSELF